MKIDYVKVIPSGLVIIPEFVGRPKKYYSIIDNKHDLTTEDNKTKGELSENSKRKIKSAMLLLVTISKLRFTFNPNTMKKIYYRITFITLTLSAAQNEHSDYKIKHELLNHFLVQARQKWGMKSYIWKAETQKNGNIHFHITTNVYIDHQELRDTWNNIQKKLGYIDLFNEKHHHINPNSTDIHSVRKIKNLGAYVAKYISKESDKRRKIEGKIWGCSRNLLIRNNEYIMLEGKTLDQFNDLITGLNLHIYEDDYYSFVYMSEDQLKHQLPEPFNTNYQNYLKQVKTS